MGVQQAPEGGGTVVVQIRAGFNLAFDCDADTSFIFMIYIRPERHRDLIEPEKMTLFPQVRFDTYIDGFGNICTSSTACRPLVIVEPISHQR